MEDLIEYFVKKSPKSYLLVDKIRAIDKRKHVNYVVIDPGSLVQSLICLTESSLISHELRASYGIFLRLGCKNNLIITICSIKAYSLI